jgi:hypothetical protein
MTHIRQLDYTGALDLLGRFAGQLGDIPEGSTKIDRSAVSSHSSVIFLSNDE